MKRDDLISEVVNLRKRGFSLREISERLRVSKSSVSVWARNIPLSEKAKSEIVRKQRDGRQRGIESSRTKKRVEENMTLISVRSALGALSFDPLQSKAVCALLYGCEGSKVESGRVVFVNSDPQLVRFFLRFFRQAFLVDEKKFRALVHIHGYHDEKKQVRFWSGVTGIPESQFTQSYRKKNGGKNIREGYQGCVSVRYNDVKVQREILLLYKEILSNGGNLLG